MRTSMIASSMARPACTMPHRSPDRARQEAGGVFQEDQRDVVDVAEADEARVSCKRRVDVDLTADATARVVGHEADDAARQTRPNAVMVLLARCGLQLEVVAVVADAAG